MRTVAILLLSILAPPLFGQIWPARVVPLHLAEPAVDESLKAFPEDRQARYMFVAGFCEAFLDSWRYASRLQDFHRNFSEEPWGQGYKAGKVAREKLEISVSPADFGYTLEVLTGTFRVGFETSEFVVSASERRFHTNLGLEDSIPETEVTVRAWVSPKSSLGYGHFNQWNQEIILTEVLNPSETGEQNGADNQ